MVQNRFSWLKRIPPGRKFVNPFFSFGIGKTWDVGQESVMESGCRQMFIDETIELREDLPERLQRDFVELRKYYDAGD